MEACDIKNVYTIPGIKKISIPEHIQIVVSEYFGIPVTGLYDRSRKNEVKERRYIGMYFTRELTGLSQAKIGVLFGGFDHATVRNAIIRVNEYIETEKDFRMKIANLFNLLN
ncbi:MAG: hypothetical protein KAT68_17850 [Bacteroidales bacterium]|nr:hypothetical protein [Bacteroidales bacterium]